MTPTPRFTRLLPRGVRRLFRLPLDPDRLARDMDDGIAAHLAMRIDELRAAGMSEADAAAEAQRRFGDVDAFSSHMKRRATVRGRRLAAARWTEEFTQDLRAAVRRIRRAPVVSAIVVLTLALSIGIATATYGVVHRLLLAPLPYDDGNRIVSLEMRKSGDGNLMWDIDASLYRLFATRSRALEDFAAYNWDRAAVGSGAAPDSMVAAAVTPSFLPMLRVHPSLGRGFVDADARPDAPLVAILGDSMWQAQFGGNPNAVGRTITVNGRVHEIVGVFQTTRHPAG